MTATPRYFPIRHDWAEPFRISRESLTDVEVADDGSEVRAQLRDTPNIAVAMRGVFPNERGAGGVLAAFRGATRPLLYFVPLWCDAADITGAVSIGAGSVACVTTTRPFLAGAERVMLWRDERTNEMIAVDSTTDSSVTFDGTTVNAYPLGSRVVPLRPMWLTLPVPVTWRSEKIASIPLSFTDQKPQAAFGLDDAATTAVPASVKIFVHSGGATGEAFGGLATFLIFVEAIVYDASGIPIDGATGEWTSDPDVTVFPLPDVRKARVLVENNGSLTITFTSGAASHSITIA